MNTRKSIIAIAIVAAVTVLVYYRYFPKTPQTAVNEKSTETTKELTLAISKEVNAFAVYDVPGGVDKVKFTLFLDRDGTILGVKSLDTVKPDEVNPNLEKFNTELGVVIKGKNLNEINKVDKIGTSSLTTAAFNKALSDLKSQI